MDRSSSTGRYFVFKQLSPTRVPRRIPSCATSTITTALLLSFRHADGATGVSTDGRYISSQRVDGGIVLYADLALSDSCVGGSAGCVPETSVLLPLTLTPGSTMSPDGRYILYAGGTGNAIVKAFPLLLFDTCTGAPPGCTQTSIPIASTSSSIANLADGRFIVWDMVAFDNSDFQITTSQITLHDSCLGAAPGCVPSGQGISGLSLLCRGPFISRDAQYVSYQCRSNDASVSSVLYTQNTCARAPSACVSTPQLLSLPEAVHVNITASKSGGRFVFFEVLSSPLNNHDGSLRLR